MEDVIKSMNIPKTVRLLLIILLFPLLNVIVSTYLTYNHLQEIL